MERKRYTANEKRLKSASDIIGNLAIVCCFDKQSPLYREKYNSGEEGFCVFASNEPKFMLA